MSEEREKREWVGGLACVLPPKDKRVALGHIAMRAMASLTADIPLTCPENNRWQEQEKE